MTIPSLPIEIVEYIISFIPPHNTSDLCHLSLSSRSLHAASQKALYELPQVNPYKKLEALALLERTIRVNQNLGRTVRALRLYEREAQETDMELVAAMVDACKGGLEELWLERMELSGVADLLAAPRLLRLVNLDHCRISEPATIHSFSPTSTVKYLATHYSRFTCASLPPQSFPALISYSRIDPPYIHLVHSLEFLLNLPLTLKALRMYLGDNWQLSRDDAPLAITYREGLERTLRHNMGSLDRFEMDYHGYIPGQPDRNGFLYALKDDGSIRSLRLFVDLYSEAWQSWVNDWVNWFKFPERAPGCLDKIETLYVELNRTSSEEAEVMKELRYWCEEKKGMKLVVDRGTWSKKSDADPFWSDVVDGKRWLWMGM